ncbi:hypothetical protein BJY52DRAFT_1188014 [Lactarius psammicola]|nr:hypothetical protein BJY52DRAFT_1188014 [Lactarius psammicola]
MASYFIGPMPLQEFLDLFLPETSVSPCPSPFQQGMFSPLTKMVSKTEMYDTLIKIVSPHLPSLAVVNTSCMKDKAPYTSAGSDHKHGINMSHIEFPIEFKNTLDQDPFSVELISSDHLEITPFMNSTIRGRQTARQITAYATSVLSAQYCTHTFLLLIIKDFARLIQWDRGGVVVTAPIFYNQDPDLLQFLICYGNATHEVCGHNPTVGPPTKGEA